MSDSIEVATKPVYVVQWDHHNGHYDGDGYREWAMMATAGYSFHRRLHSVIDEFRRVREHYRDEFLHADFPSYIAVPQRDWMNGHNIPVYRLRLPLAHPFHRAATREPDGNFIERLPDRGTLTNFFNPSARPRPKTTRGLERVMRQAITRADTKPIWLPYTAFWPEKQTPDVW